MDDTNRILNRRTRHKIDTRDAIYINVKNTTYIV